MGPLPTAEKENDTTLPEPGDKGPVADMALLIGRMREFLKDRRLELFTYRGPLDSDTLSDRFGFRERKGGKPEIILSEDVARELGHPSTESRTVVLVTFEPGLVRTGEISRIGPDLNLMKDGHRYPFAQVVLLEISPDGIPDPFELDNTQFLMNRLPGYMVRSVPGKLWVRISREGIRRGLTLGAVGSALVASYTRGFQGVKGVEVVFVTSCDSDVYALDPIAAEAGILAGRHKKLVLGVDGEVECPELDCESCEEKPVCDSLRDIVIKRRATKGE